MFHLGCVLFSRSALASSRSTFLSSRYLGLFPGKVLLELKEYAQEVDVEFVRKAVRAIGRCAIKLERAAERCINVLLELIQTKVNYVLQEAVIVIKVRVLTGEKDGLRGSRRS